MTPPSPNFGERRGGVLPDIIVIHYTAMATCAEARARLCDPVAEVSAHWLVDLDGTAEALVPEHLRAWHAGAGEWAGVSDVNSRSIGIELTNPGNAPFPWPQMKGLEPLLAGIMDRWSIPAHRVIGHSDMAPARKRDPGARFDWRGLARAGLAVWPASGDADPPGFAAAARTIGYPEAAPETLLAAFRLRFRPWATGPLDPIDAGMAADLARRFPVDAAGANA